MSFYDAYSLLDVNKDGFFTANEIDILDKILKLSRRVKDGLFAYLDNTKIGMVDYQRFLNVINKPEHLPVSIFLKNSI